MALALKSVGWKDPDYLAHEMANRVIGRWSNQDSEGKHSLSTLAPHVAEGKLGPCFESFHTNYKVIRFTIYSLFHSILVLSFLGYWFVWSLLFVYRD